MESRSPKPLVTKLERYFIPFVLQTKAFQGHYIKHKEIVELRNISLIDTVPFVWYDYREYMFNNIKSLPHIGDLQTKAFGMLDMMAQRLARWAEDREVPGSSPARD